MTIANDPPTEINSHPHRRHPLAPIPAIVAAANFTR